MTQDPATCAEHRQQINGLDRRLAVLETVIGSSSADGLRGLLAQISDQLGQLTASVRDLQLAQARATGAVDGATWVGRGIWAVLGAAITAAVLTMLKGGTP